MKALLVSALTVTLLACGPRAGPEAGGDAMRDSVDVTVPAGATFRQVVDSLTARGLVGRPALFTLFARMRGDDRQVRSGQYRLEPGASWSALLDALTAGRVVPVPLTIPEGWTLREMAPRIAELSDVPPEEVTELLASEDLPQELGVPGPGLEGYLFPDTYLFARGVRPIQVVEAMAEAYVAVWTPERRARLDSLGMTERELVTLASIVQAEAGNEEEMPLIAGVYRNRLRDGWLLQADPTVLYALGDGRERLTFPAIDSVADNPYNTYRQPGLPPGPIGSPGLAALDAALNPSDVSYMFFVAGPDGGHVFSTTLAEHNRAVAEFRRRRAEARGSGS